MSYKIAITAGALGGTTAVQITAQTESVGTLTPVKQGPYKIKHFTDY